MAPNTDLYLQNNNKDFKVIYLYIKSICCRCFLVDGGGYEYELQHYLINDTDRIRL